MAGKIGELFVALGFDVDDQKLNDFIEKMKVANESMLKLSASAIAGIGALSAFVQTAADNAVKLNNMTSDFGASTKAAQTFANALHEVNQSISFDQALDKYAKFSTLIRELIPQGRGGEATGALARLGGEYFAGADPETIRQNLARNKQSVLATLSSNPAEAKAIYAGLLESIGLGGATRLFDRNEEQYQASGRNNVSQENLDKLQKFADNTAELSNAFHKFTMDMAADFSSLSIAVNGLISVLNYINGFKEEHPAERGLVNAGLLAVGGSALGSIGSKLPVVGNLLGRVGPLGWFGAIAEANAYGMDKGKEFGEDLARRGYGKDFRKMIFGYDPMENKEAYGPAMPAASDEPENWLETVEKAMQKQAQEKLNNESLQENTGRALQGLQGGKSPVKIDMSIHSTAPAHDVAKEVKRELQGQLNAAGAQTNLGESY